MRWAWRIAIVSGIPIYLHGTFTILIGFLLFSGLFKGWGLTAALSNVFFVLAIFAAIVLHELGHALTARRFGIRTRDITLLPIGGVARLERMPDIPRQELWVALAGPAVNILLAAVCYMTFTVVTGGSPSLTLDPSATGFVGRFSAVNVALAVFNLLPAFPMDGGRALRALLAERIDYVRATEIAANIGQGLALAFGLIGLFLNPWLVFIALFVWIGASNEASLVAMRGALAGVQVSRAMITNFRSVSVDSPLSDPVARVLDGAQRDFPVTDGGRLVGILTRDKLVSALTERGPASPVRKAMTTEFETADALEMLDGAFIRLQSTSCNVLPVLYRGRLVGLLTLDNIGEYVTIQGAIGKG